MTKNWNKIFGEAIDDFGFDLKKENGQYILKDITLGDKFNLGNKNKEIINKIEVLVDRYWYSCVFDDESLCYGIAKKDLPKNDWGRGFSYLNQVIDWYTPEMKTKYPGKEGYVDICECFQNHLDEINIDKVYSYMHENEAKKDIKWDNYEKLVADRYGFATSIELLSQAGFSNEEINELGRYENIDVSKVLYPNEWFGEDKVDEAEKLGESGIRFAPYNDTLYNFYHNVPECSACMLKADNSDRYWVWYSNSLDNEDLEENCSSPVVIKDALWDKDHKSFILIGCSLNKGEFFEDENINLEFVSLEEGIKQIEKEYNKKFYHFNNKVNDGFME